MLILERGTETIYRIILKWHHKSTKIISILIILVVQQRTVYYSEARSCIILYLPKTYMYTEGTVTVRVNAFVTLA